MDAWMKPMLCNRAPTVEGYDPDEWAAEAKIDGWRAICHVNGGTVKVCGGRNGSDYSGQVPYLENDLLAALPDDTCIDGELTSDQGWGGVQGAMTRAGCGDDSIRLVVFDVIRLAGHDVRPLPWHERRALLERFVPSGRLELSPLFPVQAQTLDVVIDHGFEGLVLKRKSSRYVNGRSAAWVKVKPKAADNVDGRIVGFKPGKAGGEFAGMVGAFEIELLDSGVRTTVKCGIKERHREATDHPERWLGQIIEISHHGLGKTGVPRHPQFFRRRDDRAPSPVTAQPTRPRRSHVSSTYRMRNYAAMKDEKLLRCVDELANNEGDAYERCVQKGGSPVEDLEVARAEASRRGL